MANRQYVSREEVQARAGSQLADRDLDSVIEAVTDRIERETRRVFLVSDLETRPFDAQRDGYCTIDDLQRATSVIVDGVTLTADQYRLRALNPRAAYHAITSDQIEEDSAVEVRGYWGTTDEVPPEIKDIAITWVRRIIKSDDSGGSQDATAIPELGQLVYSKAVPADVKRVLDRWRRVTP
jgi:hypothetical protein